MEGTRVSTEPSTEVGGAPGGSQRGAQAEGGDGHASGPATQGTETRRVARLLSDGAWDAGTEPLHVSVSSPVKQE